MKLNKTLDTEFYGILVDAIITIIARINII
jgi:hypothetical protein